MKKALTMLRCEVMSTSSTPASTAGKPDKSMFARLGVLTSGGDLALDITNRIRSLVGARIVFNKNCIHYILASKKCQDVRKRLRKLLSVSRGDGRGLSGRCRAFKYLPAVRTKP